MLFGYEVQAACDCGFHYTLRKDGRTVDDFSFFSCKAGVYLETCKPKEL